MIREHNKTFEKVPVMFSNNYFVKINNNEDNLNNDNLNNDNLNNENKNSVELNA